MTNFQIQYDLWDEFLKIWPLSRLREMTLEDYTEAGSKATFTYWIEAKLEELGSVWGGSAFKFGVYSRNAKSDKDSANGRSYSDTHGWYSFQGNTAAEAFDKVRSLIVQIATLAGEGKLAEIEKIRFGEVIKWKIAFLYQDRHAPRIVSIYKRKPLASFAETDPKKPMFVLQEAVIAKRPQDMGILEFGSVIWNNWSEHLTIWKLSHSPKQFAPEEVLKYLDRNQAVMHGSTEKGQGRNFMKAEDGSLFYLCNGNKEMLVVGQFLSGPEPSDKDEDGGWFQRRYRILAKAIQSGSYGGNARGWAPNYNSTFMAVSRDDLEEFERTLLKPFFGIDLTQLADRSEETSETGSLNNPSSTEPALSLTTPMEPRRKPINRIYYGPPGTGKTYALTNLLKRDYEQKTEDIPLEERRRQIIAEKIAHLTWWEGLAAALYDLGGSAKVPELSAHPFIKAITESKEKQRNVSQTLWLALRRHTVYESTTLKIRRRNEPTVFDKSEDSTWRLAGEWKEECAGLIEIVDDLKKEQPAGDVVKRYDFVTFHQSYGYEEFVEGLRPVIRDDNDEPGEVSYEIHAGAFKKLCKRAEQSPGQHFAMVIDEINRGNISKIFGELITLIECDKRKPLDGSAPPVVVKLSYSQEEFSVPANVDIIGTMNTADRSLALLDTALRRRFDFVPLMPDTRSAKVPGEPESAPLADLFVGEIDVRSILEVINQRIEMLYDRDHCIGHAYFTHIHGIPEGDARFQELAAIFRNRIIPLLEEYFFEDWRKIRLVLGDNQKSSKFQFITEEADSDQNLIKLFGGDHGLDTYGLKSRYELQQAAFGDPRSYIGIYEK